MITRILCLIAALVPFSFADVQFVSPAAGDSITGLTIDISWQESQVAPPITSLTSYQLFLCAGGNTEGSYIQLATLVSTGDFADGDTATGSLTSTLGGNSKNAYFLKMISAATGGTVINFSNRFSLPSMTGTFPANVLQALRSVSGTTGPATQNNINNVAPAPTSAAASQFSVPYSLQTGPIRYAPMPKQPGTSITAKNASPLYPTSAYTIFTVAGGPADASTTQTQNPTYGGSSKENPVAAAPMPTDTAAQKFLNRWKD